MTIDVQLTLILYICFVSLYLYIGICVQMIPVFYLLIFGREVVNNADKEQEKLDILLISRLCSVNRIHQYTNIQRGTFACPQSGLNNQGWLFDLDGVQSCQKPQQGYKTAETSEMVKRS